MNGAILKSLLAAGAGLCLSAGSASASPFLEPDVDVLYTLTTNEANSQFGFVAETIGDLDGDGVTEFIVGQPRSQAGAFFGGQVHIYSGVTGMELHAFQGAALDFLGTSVAGLGDVDNDGIPDYAVSAPGVHPIFNLPSPARVIVFSGASHSVIYEVSSVIGSRFGQDILSAGDVNGDGRNDLIVGSPFDDRGAPDAGRVHVFDGATGAELWFRDGDFANDSLGSAVSGITDQNGDGTPDVVAGAFENFQGGHALVLSGADGGKLDTLTPLETGVGYGQFFAHDVGDVDSDGTSDFYVGDLGDTKLGNGTGRAYVYSGADRSPIRILDGDAPLSNFGIGRGVGDVNGDGHADLFLAAYQHDDGASDAGKAYLYSGKDGGVIRTYTGTVAGNRLGFDALPLADVNGDGIQDYILTGKDIVHVVAGTDASPEGRIASLCELIGSIPAEAFSGPADNRKDALCNKLKAFVSALGAGASDEAVNKINNDIRAKADGSLGGDPGDDWIVDPFWQSFLDSWFEGLARLASYQ